MISVSKTPEDPSHAENTLNWLLVLKPNADEILKLAAYAHDVERATPDRVLKRDFEIYEDYKRAHAARGSKIAYQVLRDSGFTEIESNRIATLISEAEFSSKNEDVQLICDADSISFFDNNLAYYLKARGSEEWRHKVKFMFERSSPRAQAHIKSLMKRFPEINL